MGFDVTMESCKNTQRRPHELPCNLVDSLKRTKKKRGKLEKQRSLQEEHKCCYRIKMVHTEIHALKLIVAIKRRYESGTNRGVGKTSFSISSHNGICKKVIRVLL